MTALTFTEFRVWQVVVPARQDIIGASPPKDGPFMPKTDLDIVPKWPVPMYSPSGTGFFFSLTIPTDTVKKK